MTITEQIKKVRQSAGTVRAGFYRLDAVKNIPYKREALNIRELMEELEALERLTAESEIKVNASER